MILEYHRPETIEQALELLKRGSVKILPLAGGTVLNQPNQEAIEVVDLQSLGLDRMERAGKTLRVGAMVRLQALLEANETMDGLREVIRLEAPVNLRQAATIGGTAAAGDGRSPLLTALLALDAGLETQQAETPVTRVDLGDWLPVRGGRRGELITAVSLPMNVKLVYQYVARTPADLPIIGVAVAQWPSGRTRLALCGWGAAPMLVMDGPESGGAGSAARNTASESGDAWGSSEYRQTMAEVLTSRALKLLESNREGDAG
jgi:probable selenate reductase FAD-binding subunit